MKNILTLFNNLFMSNTERLQIIDAIKFKASKIIIGSQVPVLESLVLRILFRREFDSGRFVNYEGQIGLKHDGHTKPYFIYLDIENLENGRFIEYLNRQCFDTASNRSEEYAKPSASK